MANKTVTFTRETRVDQLYAEGAHGSFDAETAAALIEQGYAVAGKQDIAPEEPAEPAPVPAIEAPKGKTAV